VSPFPFATKGFIETALEDIIVQKWIGAEATGSMPKILRREAGRYAELWGDSRLVHGDFNPTNILIQAGAVSGVLDWEFSHAGTPYMDIGNLLRHTDPLYHPAIKAGLEAGGMTLPDDWQERAELVDISSQFEFLTSGRSDAFKRECVARIHAFVRKYL
jgi:aminoglycoside phosphotransferase (APT) family kinase protein